MSADRDPLADIDRVILALNDWCSTYAQSEVSAKTLDEAQNRIWHGGGTVGYIADALEAARAVRELILSEGKPTLLPRLWPSRP